MKIYTKRGDNGSTSILGQNIISKADLRIAAIGDIDELNAYLGLVLCHVHNEISHILNPLQSELFIIGSNLAVVEGFDKKITIPKLKDADISRMESQIDNFEEQLPQMTHFILPSGNEAIAHLHILRSICRRAERSLVALNQITEIDAIIIKYINRMSDLLFVAARIQAQLDGIEEIKWHPNKDAK